MHAHDTRGVKFNSEELSRYARHLSLDEVGLDGQKLLKASSILCVGTGGLGSPLLLYLAATGIGRLGIIDFDVVEVSNLQRQVIHGTSWLKKTKTSSAKAHIKELNPFCKVDIYETLLDESNALEIIKEFDLVCDCTDNFPSRYLINDACVILGKPNIYGSVAKFEGQVTVFNLDTNSPNYRDLVPEPPPAELVNSCEEGGVLGVLPGLVGIIQATEAIKIITGIGKTLSGRLLVIDALAMSFRELSLQADPNSKKISHLINYKDFCSIASKKRHNSQLKKQNQISVQELKSLLEVEKENIILLDVRNPNEFLASSISGAKLIPLKSIESGESINQIKKLTSNRQLYVHCKSGARSSKALKILNNYGIQGINVSGGIDAWNKEIEAKSNN